MMERKTLFVDVMLPLHLPDTYTYRVPFEYNDSICVGQRVVVQFGTKRLYSALVRRLHDKVPTHTAKYILSILDIEPIVDEHQFRLWEWMAEYYMCCPGDVMAMALPSSLRLSSESYVVVHPDFEGEYGGLGESEIKILDVLSRNGRIAVDEVASIVGYQKTMPVVKSMIERNILLMEEELHERYKPRKSIWLSLANRYSDEEELHSLFDSLEKKTTSHKQLMVMMKFMQLSAMGKNAIPKKSLTELKELSQSALATLIKKQIIVEQEKEESRLDSPVSSEMPNTMLQLSPVQQKAYDTLISSDKAVNLLYGVTSSGKTEVYIRLISDTIDRGHQVLFLLPEIALTTQIINRLRKFFGGSVGIYHSRFSTQERAEVWLRTMDASPKGYKVLVGARSALFLPFHNLGLVIVDEEHDGSYKQNEPAPRYNGRDSAIWLANLWKARTVLGSATPSVESFFNAQNGKYGYAEMTERYGGAVLPEVLCADMKEASRRGELRMNFSQLLIEHVKKALADGKQVILFQNRRGFAPRIECDSCNWVPQCKHCDVSLVFHKATHSLRCHYCGYSIPVPQECPQCHSTMLKMRGFGTERIEDDLGILFPDAKVARMDLDTTTQKKRYAEIINDFEEHRIDILVGTQMVTKGLDFDNVGVVGILSADNLISYPDFRSYERSFQQMTQVSGRAGRAGERGTVVIQSYQPYHQAIRDAMECDYLSMYGSQIVERRVFRYPPFYRLIYVTLKHRDSQMLNAAADTFAASLRERFSSRVMGPEYPNVARVRNWYLKRIMIRFERTEPVSEGKRIILSVVDALRATEVFRGVQIIFDVDPL